MTKPFDELLPFLSASVWQIAHNTPFVSGDPLGKTCACEFSLLSLCTLFRLCTFDLLISFCNTSLP